jgi:multisubunit Na+/H+ antiporter MnhF subunit
MNLWQLASVALLAPLIASVWVTFRGPSESRLVGLEYAGLAVVLMLLFLAEGFGRADFIDLALALGLLAFGGGMVFVRFLENKL